MPDIDKIVAHLTEAPVVEISDGVAKVRDRSGATQIERAMSVRDFEKYVERGTRALARYAAGEQNVIVDD